MVSQKNVYKILDCSPFLKFKAIFRFRSVSDSHNDFEENELIKITITLLVQH